MAHAWVAAAGGVKSGVSRGAHQAAGPDPPAPRARATRDPPACVILRNTSLGPSSRRLNLNGDSTALVSRAAQPRQLASASPSAAASCDALLNAAANSSNSTSSACTLRVCVCVCVCEHVCVHEL